MATGVTGSRRAKKDLKRALDADLPRRFRKAVQGMLEEPQG
jgi:hypothetical protein